ncbi:tetraspanin-5-like [Acanthaster planci]|uniref:Tetraspanin-15 n=1 Tax=Acanthaster planci TaxID=133434 RepID=A0A8B7XIM0_ACAPL|nr:tetraspanin-5-like [Acanthaster planci]XP_022079970.1 tetraspanin-5-like [Acanthaster planci]
MGRKTEPLRQETAQQPPPPYTVNQQMRYPEMRDQGYYLQSVPQQPQQPYGRPQQPLPQAQQQSAQKRPPQQQQQQRPRQQQQKQQRQQQQQRQQKQPKMRQQQQKVQQQQQHQQHRRPSLRRFRRAPPGVEVSPCIKYTLFFLNMVFWLLGVFLLGFGIWGVVSKALASVEAIAEVAGIGFDPMYGFIIVGAVIFILATSGCIGALRENTCMLKFFAYTLILIFLAEITIGVLAYFYQDKVFAILEGWINSSIRDYYDDPDTQFILDGLQENLQCCGSANGPADWEKNIYFNCSSPARSKCSVPYSCCQADPVADVVNYQCGYGALEPREPSQPRPDVYFTGCVNAMKDWFISNAIVLGVAGGVLIIMECLVICLAKSLVNDIECVKSYW